jgi:hypothetical protein
MIRFIVPAPRLEPTTRSALHSSHLHRAWESGCLSAKHRRPSTQLLPGRRRFCDTKARHCKALGMPFLLARPARPPALQSPGARWADRSARRPARNWITWGEGRRGRQRSNRQARGGWVGARGARLAIGSDRVRAGEAASALIGRRALGGSGREAPASQLGHVAGGPARPRFWGYVPNY